MIVVEAPDKILSTQPDKSLFLAGGITGCPDWQSKIISTLELSWVSKKHYIYNPRRKDFDASNKDVEFEQISWEYEHLEQCDKMIFWFPCETLCPITLFELGKWCNGNKILAIGIDPKYQRKADIEVQMSLMNNDIPIVYNLEDLITTILNKL